MDDFFFQSENSMPRIGDYAPAFRAVTTQGTIYFLPIILASGLFYSAILQILFLHLRPNLRRLQPCKRTLKS